MSLFIYLDPEAAHEAKLGALEGCRVTSKALQGSETETKYVRKEAMESSAFPDKIMMKLKQNVDIF